MALKRLATWAMLTGIAVAMGFGLAIVALNVVNGMLPPFRVPEDDDSMRELVPVAVAYGVWGVTSLLGSALAWRWTGRRFARRPVEGQPAG